MRFKTLVLLLLVSVCLPAVYGNHLHFETFHVLPQVADGRFTDNTYYRTTFNVMPFFSDANCVLVLYGYCQVK